MSMVGMTVLVKSNNATWLDTITAETPAFFKTKTLAKVRKKDLRIMNKSKWDFLSVTLDENEINRFRTASLYKSKLHACANMIKQIEKTDYETIDKLFPFLLKLTTDNFKQEPS